MRTVRVLGGGLSGLATAVLAAGRGMAVEVRDRRLERGGRFGGGFQVLENGSGAEDALDELARLGLPPSCEAEPLTGAVLLDHHLRRYEVSSELPYAYLIRRGQGAGTLDTWLRGAAERAGVRVASGVAEPDWAPDVVATGPTRADGVARELIFRTDHPDLIAVLFDPELTPSGYSYLFVRNGFATMGAAQVRHLERLRDNAARAFARLREAFAPSVEEPREQVLYMSFAVPRSLQHRGTWYVGEAAGVQHFLFGLGNRLAVRSSALVAAALAGDGWDETTFRRTLVRPMVSSILGRAAFEATGRRATSLLCRWLAAGDFRERLLAMNRPSVWRLALARAVMARWRAPASDRRLPLAAWSRRSAA